jgi:hypothetical protein
MNLLAMKHRYSPNKKTESKGKSKMAENFASKNADPKLEAAIRKATTPEEIRELVIGSGSRHGVLTRERDGSLTLNDPSQYVAPAPVQPMMPQSDDPASFKCWRVIYPHANDRFELFGASEAELDEKEKTIRAMY